MSNTIVSSYIPFPNIYWWAHIQNAATLALDGTEHFEKMTYRNKYFINGSNGGIQLSIPLLHGREQRTIMQQVRIDNKQRWQTQHWRTLVSVYKRTPYFEHYEPVLQNLYTQNFDLLIDFNLASIKWLQKELHFGFTITYTDDYQKEYTDVTDLRRVMKPGSEKHSLQGTQPYQQVFAERNGFLPNLSMLDVLFAEGPYAVQWLRQHTDLVIEWGTTKQKRNNY